MINVASETGAGRMEWGRAGGTLDLQCGEIKLCAYHPEDTEQIPDGLKS